MDDHPLVREWLTNLIREQEDLEVCGEAEDTKSALAGIAASSPALAIIDISLNAASGLELIKDIRLQHPSVAAIVLSMHEEELYAELQSVRQQLQSGVRPAGGGTSSSALGSSSSSVQGNNCAEMQRDATQRMQQIQQRLQYSNSLCEKYRLAQQLGDIGVQMYSRCRILDPNGTNLASAEQMVRDGRQGQAQACTQ